MSIELNRLIGCQFEQLFFKLFFTTFCQLKEIGVLVVNLKNYSLYFFFFLQHFATGQIFCELTCLHHFHFISHAIRPPRIQFSSTIQCNFMHTISYPVLQTYVRLSPNGMHDFSLRELHIFYLPPYLSIILVSKVTYWDRGNSQNSFLKFT